jgi:hypothetical protein
VRTREEDGDELRASSKFRDEAVLIKVEDEGEGETAQLKASKRKREGDDTEDGDCTAATKKQRWSAQKKLRNIPPAQVHPQHQSLSQVHPQPRKPQSQPHIAEVDPILLNAHGPQADLVSRPAAQRHSSPSVDQQGPWSDLVTMPAAKARPFRFLDLPKEIRLMDYECLSIRTRHMKLLVPIPLTDCNPTRFFSLVHEIMALVVLRSPGVSILASCRLVHEEAKGFLTAKLDTILARTPKLIASADAARCCLHREGAPQSTSGPGVAADLGCKNI